jgi:ABC-type antimicrobial peptide transport system permease subunit
VFQKRELFRVGVYDATTLVMVILILVMVTILGIALPILKVAKIDPANTLREE